MHQSVGEFEPGGEDGEAATEDLARVHARRPELIWAESLLNWLASLLVTNADRPRGLAPSNPAISGPSAIIRKTCPLR